MVFYYSKFSLKAEGKIFGINFIRIGNNKLPPNNKKIVKDGMVLKMYNNFFLPFSFPSKSLWVEWANETINSSLWENFNRIYKCKVCAIYVHEKCTL